MKIKLLLGLIVLLVSGCTSIAAAPIEAPAIAPTEQVSNIANPAAVYCEEQGYDYEIRETADGGEYGVCVSQDGECDAWVFYNGECSLDPINEGESDELTAPTGQPTEPLTYANADYGFTFSYPPEWMLIEDSGGYQVAGGMASPSIMLSQGTLRLHIQYKRPQEMTILGPGGRPAGQVEDRGTVVFLGQNLPKHVLTFEGKDKSVFYGERLADLEFYIQLDDERGQSVDYEAIELANEVQSEVDAILETFVRITPLSEPGSAIGWLGYVVSTPDGAQFDDYVVLLPEGAGKVGISGATDEIETEIEALRDKPEPGKQAHFWGTLTCDVPDYGNCQLLVTRLRYGPTDTEPEPVEGWEGVLVSNPPGAQFDDYFILMGDLAVGYGIHSLAPEIQGQLEGLRDTGNPFRVWGQLRCGVPDAFGSQIEVTRIEVVNSR